LILIRNKVHTALIGLLILVCPGLNGQQSNTFYLMHDVPQSNLLNPAVQPICKLYVGIPGLASEHISCSNTAFTYNDLAGTDRWNIEGITNQMHRVDLYSVEALLNLVSIGYRHKALYFTFNIAENAHIYQTIPRDLVEMVFHGNGPFVRETARFDALRPSGYYLREYSLGVSRIMSERLTTGIRASLLFGKAGLTTTRSKGRFTTGEDNFDLSLEADYIMNSSFPLTIGSDQNGYINDITVDELNPAQLLLNRGNPGFSFDFGAIYEYDENITLSASLLDIGFVRWRTDVNNVHFSGIFDFEGVDGSLEFISRDFVLELRDSIAEIFNSEISERPYFSFQPGQLYMGASYHLNDRIDLEAVNRNVIFRHKLHSSLTLAASADLANRVLAKVSWSYLNNSIKNIGIGLAYHGKGFQFHAVSDNLLGFFYPFNTRTINLRAGMNILIGCPRKGARKIQSESYGPQRKGDCSWTGNKKVRKAIEKQTRKKATR